jgi:hypothetical protein
MVKTNNQKPMINDSSPSILLFYKIALPPLCSILYPIYSTLVVLQNHLFPAIVLQSGVILACYSTKSPHPRLCYKNKFPRFILRDTQHDSHPLIRYPLQSSSVAVGSADRSSAGRCLLCYKNNFPRFILHDTQHESHPLIRYPSAARALCSTQNAIRNTQYAPRLPSLSLDTE